MLRIFISLLILLQALLVNAQNSKLIGYLHNWDSWDAPWIHPDSVDNRYSVIIIAFAIPASNTNMTMQFTPEKLSQSAFKQAIASLQSKGKKVLLSIGGASAFIDFPHDSSKNAFVHSMNTLIDTYGFDGIDIDIEHGNCILINNGGSIQQPTNQSMIRLIDGIKSIMNHYRTSNNNKMMLTMAPETAYVQGGKSAFGSIWGGYLPIIHALRDSIDILQVQLYNSGSMYGNDGMIYSQGNSDFICAMTEAVIQGFSTNGGQFTGLPQSKVAIGLPACSAAAGGGYVDTANIKKAILYLQNKAGKPGTYTLQNSNGYPNIGGVMTWSINWDAKQQCNGAYSLAEVHEKIFESQQNVLPPELTQIMPQFGSKVQQDTILFRWNSYPQRIQYHLEILKGNSIIRQDSTLIDTVYRLPHYDYSALHTWRIRVKNSAGWGPWSSPWTFITKDDPITLPSIVNVISPIQNANVDKDSAIHFVWQPSSPAITSYTFSISLNDSLIHQATGIRDTHYVYKLPDFGKTYRWSIIAVNPKGNSNASEIRFINSKEKSIDLPSVVELLSPTYQQIIRSDSITFVWHKANPTILHYQCSIQLDTSILLNDSIINDTVLTLMLPPNHGTIQWRIRAYNKSGYGKWSAHSIAIYSPLPPLPRKVHGLFPKHLAIINIDSLQCSWNKDSLAKAYILTVLHNDILYLKDTVELDTMITVYGLLDRQQYHWNVQAINERGSGLVSDTHQCTVEFLSNGISYQNEPFTLYPNPVSDILFLHLSELSPLDEVDIFTINGNCIMSLQRNHFQIAPDSLESIAIDISQLPNGLYYVSHNKFIRHFSIVR